VTQGDDPRLDAQMEVSSEPPVRLELLGSLALVTLNRPASSNALSRPMLLELGKVGRRLAEEPRLRAIVLTGTGEKAFCAGADLKERKGMTEAWVLEQLTLYRTELDWIETSKIPTIAAINGHALGGGLELALMCDLRVAATKAVLGLPETSLGIIPAAGGTQRLPRIVGEARAKQLLLRAERLTAAQALAIGLVHHVVPEAEPLLEAVREWLEPVLAAAPLAQSAALTAVNAARHAPLEEGLRRERELYEGLLHTEDRREALAAFGEKRTPIFKGR
jgi:methylglutaconyl-CoA hydratase